MGNCECSEEEETNEISYARQTNYARHSLNQIEANSYARQTNYARHSLNQIEANLVTDKRRMLGLYSGIETTNGYSSQTSDILFENGFIVNESSKVFIDDETCAICAYDYDEAEHLPMILPCGHTICNQCAKEIARKTEFEYLKCPLDRKCHIIKQWNKEWIVNPLFSEQDFDTFVPASESAYDTQLTSTHPENTDNRGNILEIIEQDSPPASETGHTSSRAQRDIYDDELSIISYDWVEPDYSSESDSFFY